MPKAADAPTVWGLTGGIASGKSTVAAILTEEGFGVIDADRISRELSAPGGKAHPLIVKRFGTADRAKLRELVFADADARRVLEGILHPLIQEASETRFAEIARTKPGKPIFYEATLLIEAGRHQDFDGLIVVESPLEIRKARLLARDRIEGQLAAQIIAAQLSDEARRNAATVVIVNDGSVEHLRERVRELIREHGWTRP